MRARPTLAVLTAAVAVAAAVGHARSTTLPTFVDSSFYAKSLRGRISVAVYLPPGYETSGKRYPVVYFLHGLPASPTAYRGASFVAQALGGRAILVAPQGARAGDSDPEYHDWGPGRNWETALGSELPAWVDARFRSIPDRRGRALVGLSAGGYGAFLIGFHHLDQFAAIESWSGYFHPTDPSGTRSLDVGSDAENRRASARALLPSVAVAVRADPTFVAFYVGAGDSRFAPENVALDRQLRADRVPHLFELYAGGHAQALWQAHAAQWLGLALARLSPPRGS